MEINGDTKTIDDKIWINKDVPVKWEISDIVEDKDYSGLSSIRVEVNGIEIENQDLSVLSSIDDGLITRSFLPSIIIFNTVFSLLIPELELHWKII